MVKFDIFRADDYENVIFDLFYEWNDKAKVADELANLYNIQPYDERERELLRKKISRFLRRKKDSYKKHINSYYDDLIDEEEDDGEEIENSEIEIDLEYGHQYLYKEETDEYFFFINDFSKPVVLKGETIRAIKDEYSSWDENPRSVNQICRAYEIPRKIFIKIKTILGWTHDSEPYTDEEIERRDEEEMAESALQKRKYRLHQTFEKKKQKELEQNAYKWVNFEENVLNPLIETINYSAPNYSVPKLNTSNNEEEHAVVLSPYDLHYGKYGWAFETNEGYDRVQAEELLITKTQNLINKHLLKYNVEKIVVPIGSDFLHVDHENFTTSGTPQDLDGTINQIIWEGSQLMVKFIDILRKVSNVEIIMAPGNHDQTQNLNLLLFLSAWFKDSNDITIHTSSKVRQYLKYGVTLLGFTHGDRIKETDLKERMPAEVPEWWGNTKFRAFFTGHKHFEYVNGEGSITIYQMPTLCGSSRYDHKRGFENNKRSIVGYLISKYEGINANLMSNVVDDPNHNFERLKSKEHNDNQLLGF